MLSNKHWSVYCKFWENRVWVKELWNFCSHVLSLPGTKVPYMELSLPRTFVPGERKWRRTFTPRNFRSHSQV